MKKYSLALVAFCLGLCVGVALCYAYRALPQRENAAAGAPPKRVSDRQQIVITITADGAIYLAGERIEPNRLPTRLKELGGEWVPIAIRADKGAPFKRIVEVMNEARGRRFEIAS